MTSSRTCPWPAPTRSRRLAALAATLPPGLMLLLTGCAGLELGDTPLGATADARSVMPGTPVTGTVVNPAGEITVTLAPDSLPPPAPGRNSGGAVACAYDASDATYSCPTEGLEPGLRRVEVTDAEFASEGTKLVSVAISEVSGYDPTITVRGGDRRDPAGVDGPLGFADAGGTAVLRLRGWEPGRPVVVTVYDIRRGRAARRAPRRVVPDERGAAHLRLRDLRAGDYRLQGDDGLWDDAEVEGWDPSTLLVSPR